MKFHDMQIPLNLVNNKLVADLLWMNINNSFTFNDVYTRHYAMKIYNVIYGEFIPICFSDNTNNTLPFNIDFKWINFRFELNFERTLGNEKKNFTLNYLSLQKRKKNANINSVELLRSTPSTTTLNIQELLLQNFKFSKENLNWKNLGKHILNILLGERITSSIENEVTENDELKFKTDTVLELKLNNQENSLKDVKNKLTRIGGIESLSALSEEIMNVIDTYERRKQITTEIKDEYVSFVEALLEETDKILRKKTKREERSRTIK